MKASGGLQSSATATESTDEDICDECAELADGFPCADCYINSDAEFTGEFA
ncbi:hypothetical protein [Halomarina oriensis]|uniref:hypothetical protein n=1 Tax=Halomarina oriensis TaxID=671145 RepID=UPI0018EEF9EF|nr:hypothetical protein [Halomarina oriensis]